MKELFNIDNILYNLFFRNFIYRISHKTFAKLQEVIWSENCNMTMGLILNCYRPNNENLGNTRKITE